MTTQDNTAPAQAVNTDNTDAAKVYDGVTTYPVQVDFRKRRPLLVDGNYVTTGITDKDETITVRINGSDTPVKAERIPSFVANLPVINGGFILETISNLYADSENDELEDAVKATAKNQLDKLLDYFADYHNSAITVAANKQLNDKLRDNINHKFSQADITQTDLLFWELVNREPADRKQFSDELVAAARLDFISVIPQHAKNSKGVNVSIQGAENVANIIFVKKALEKFKTNLDGLNTFQNYAGVWFSNTSAENQEKYQEYFSWLNSRIETWLNADNTAVLATFE